MDNIKSAIADYWQLFLVSVAAVLAAGAIYVFRLGSLTNDHLSSSEQMSHGNDLDWHSFVLNPINAPYKMLDFAVIHFYPHSTPIARLSSVCFAVLAILLFSIIVYRWHGRRTAFLATLLFGTSSWLLHAGRLADGNVLLVVTPLALILFASWLAKTEKHGRALLCMTLASGLALFTPGAIWFLVATLLLYIKPVSKHAYYSRFWEKSVCLVALAYFGVILAFVFIRSPSLVGTWLGSPQTWPQPVAAIAQWADAGVYLFVRGPSDATIWLAHIPILDLFTALMCLIGCFFYAMHYKNQRTRLIAAFLLIGSVMVALNGSWAMSYIVPVAYLLAATGITYFLGRWLQVFPRNPIARGIGIGLISLVVLAVSVYHVRSYFVAWRYSPSTVSAFQEQP